MHSSGLSWPGRYRRKRALASGEVEDEEATEDELEEEGETLVVDLEDALEVAAALPEEAADGDPFDWEEGLDGELYTGASSGEAAGSGGNAAGADAFSGPGSHAIVVSQPSPDLARTAAAEGHPNGAQPEPASSPATPGGGSSANANLELVDSSQGQAVAAHVSARPGSAPVPNARPPSGRARL